MSEINKDDLIKRMDGAISSLIVILRFKNWKSFN